MSGLKKCTIKVELDIVVRLNLPSEASPADERENIAHAAGWTLGGDDPCAFWFHEPTWGSWKAAASWAGTDQAPNGANARPEIYESLQQLFDSEGL